MRNDDIIRTARDLIDKSIQWIFFFLVWNGHTGFVHLNSKWKLLLNNILPIFWHKCDKLIVFSVIIFLGWWAFHIESTDLNSVVLRLSKNSKCPLTFHDIAQILMWHFRCYCINHYFKFTATNFNRHVLQYNSGSSHSQMLLLKDKYPFLIKC